MQAISDVGVNIGSESRNQVRIHGFSGRIEI
jgi:hypothetical protein